LAVFVKTTGACHLSDLAGQTGQFVKMECAILEGFSLPALQNGVNGMPNFQGMVELILQIGTLP